MSMDSGSWIREHSGGCCNCARWASIASPQIVAVCGLNMMAIPFRHASSSSTTCAGSTPVSR